MFVIGGWCKLVSPQPTAHCQCYWSGSGRIFSVYLLQSADDKCTLEILHEGKTRAIFIIEEALGKEATTLAEKEIRKLFKAN